MINPVAPFYEWYLTFFNLLPRPMILILELSVGIWLMLSVYSLFWRVR